LVVAEMSGEYTAPIEDLRFIINDVLNAEQLYKTRHYSHVDSNLVAAVLEEGGKFASEILAPINKRCDEEGSQLVDGKVITPAGFKEAYQKYIEAGWLGLDLPEEYGGQNLPGVLQVAFAEMIVGACLSFSMLPLMGRAASRLLIKHADEQLRTRVIPELVSGQWAATICISEPQAGSDVGRIRTKAVKNADGSYTLTGTKIFISFGDQDCTEQIVHMVLARTPDAPAGTRGLSLFLVPKRQYTGVDKLGPLNQVSVSRVEHKMGLKASPTCVLDLDGATGYLVGEEYAGMNNMFAMVNTMRLEVAMHGVAIGNAATARALVYARERQQGGSADKPPVSITEHADVRRMLFTMRTKSEGMRALVLETAMNLDLAIAAGGETQRAEANALAEWLLPVCKAFATDTGFEVANLAVQVFGGHGYVTDEGIEQYVRDSRVASIYEGTNGIQALDLVARKLIRDSGNRYRLFTKRIRSDIDQYSGMRATDEINAALVDALQRLDTCTEKMLARSNDSWRDNEAGATYYLHMTGLIACAWMWLRMAAAAEDDSPLQRMKRVLALFYAKHVMPEVLSLEQKIHAGADSLDVLDIDTFTYLYR
jgi:alkylation response protein AidB-like acyl-CoA dehydrogenase